MAAPETRQSFRAQQNVAYDAHSRFVCLLTVKGLKDEYKWSQGRDAARCHVRGQEAVAAGTMDVHDKFWHLIRGAEVLSYRVVDRRTGNEVPLASADPASELADAEDRRFLRICFENLPTDDLRKIVANREGGSDYDCAAAEIARAELAVRRDEPKPVKVRSASKMAELLREVAA